ncbi:methyltransferase domain-containing protein [Roseofilum sp. BLCC_M154]|uniref:Methyltransferase domain-containing protein n=1 Tax=Roseofilum acuticapitatum BLCC-M154 TaxID=3022444 RepID=A0ABT7AMC9_9CYAN|nr:methyltransferase domain-containing protein [Roseofilum acuticapitatum]MDJ1168041.1 methyltransferase domain-containing protein [Roseofilum acuticapitatum BLCC-M154]
MSELSIRQAYETWGVEEFYQQQGSTYRNPHEAKIGQVLAQGLVDVPRKGLRVLDLACGSGEVTLALRELGWEDIEGIDPYTQQAYLGRTGQVAEGFRFEEIEQGVLWGREYGLIVCSFALHLVERSRLPTLVYQLSWIGDRLMVITPHKRPDIDSQWGWTLVDEFCLERVRSRLYLSTHRNSIIY